MFCPHCGKEIPNGVKFCSICGNEIQNTPGASSGPAPLNRTTKMSKTNLIVIIASAVLILAIIGAVVIVKNMFSEPIIGTWVVYDYLEDGESMMREMLSEYSEELFEEEMSMTFKFYKDGSFKAQSTYDSETGSWENITRKADNYPRYELEIDGESVEAYIKKGKMYIEVDPWDEEVMVLKKK